MNVKRGKLADGGGGGGSMEGGGRARGKEYDSNYLPVVGTNNILVGFLTTFYWP